MDNVTTTDTTVNWTETVTGELLESRPHWTSYATVALLALIAAALILG